MKETREVMNTIRAFAAEDATVIFGTVCEEDMGDALRVTVVATGLGRTATRKQSTPFTVIKTGTHDVPMATPVGVVPSAGASHAGGDYSHFDTPAVWRSRESAAARVAAMEESGADRYDIPAFLRKQAD
jgi:cell division protein FtsZ